MMFGHNVDDGVSVEIWKVGIKVRDLESWNNGMLEFRVPSLHHSTTALFQHSFEGGNPCLELSKTCA